MGNEPMNTPIEVVVDYFSEKKRFPMTANTCFLIPALANFLDEMFFTSGQQKSEKHRSTNTESDEEAPKIIKRYLRSERFVSLLLNFRPVSQPPTHCLLHFFHMYLERKYIVVLFSVVSRWDFRYN